MRTQSRICAGPSLVVPLLAGLVVCAMSDVSRAFPGFAANCAQCHTSSGGELNIDPNPLVLFDAESGTVTFDITDLPGPGALSVTGLAAEGLNATVNSIPPWTSRDADTRFTLGGIEAIGSRMIDLTIGPGATPGDYPISVFLAGSGAEQWSTSTEFIISVPIPEPASLALVSVVLGIMGTCYLRKRRRTRSPVCF